MSSSRSTLFNFDSSSSSDDSDIEDLLDDDMEQFVLLLAAKELHEPLRKKR
jgi:flagellar motor switch protein FliG